MKFTWRTELPQILIIAAMFALAAAVWQHVPDRIPIHWNLQGQPDNYGGRGVGLLLMPTIVLGLYLLLRFVPRLDPGYANYENFAFPYQVIRFTTLGVMAVIYVFTVLAALGHSIDIGMVVSLTIGVLFLVLGNFMGKIRPNWMVGVRTPWTLSSKTSWVKTHRLAGWLFIVMAFPLMAMGFFPSPAMFVVTMSVIGALTLWMVLYSYLVWRNDPDRASPAGTLPGARD